MRKLATALLIGLLFGSFVERQIAWGQGVISLPSTGQTKCYNASGTEILCSGTGQDGEFQAGVDWPDPRFTVSGDCVTDNLTGLMWAKDANLPNGTRTWQGALDYVASMNAGSGLSGYKDWRLPNINDLLSLLNAEETNLAGWLNSQGFLNVQPVDYWSSTSNGIDTAWKFDLISDFYYGFVSNNKSDNSYVWPVRAGQRDSVDPNYPGNIWKTGQKVSFSTGDDGDLQFGVSWPNPRFTNPNRTVPVTEPVVVDQLTGLMWTRDGGTTTVGPCNGGEITWQEAFDYIKCLNSINFLNYSDWRFPNRNELRSLVDYSRGGLALPADNPFTNVQQWNWTSTTQSDSRDTASFVHLFFGMGMWQVKTYKAYVWPVRTVLITSESISSPTTPSGPSTGATGTSYSYSTGGSTSNLGHPVEYQFDWKGDGSDLSPWGSASQNKTWNTSGINFVMARARCKNDTAVVSNWSGTLSVNITINPTLTVLKSGTGSGTVTSSPAGINCGSDCSESYDQGTSVTLTPTPASGSTFGGWSGACSGTGTCVVIMNADIAVTAAFSAGPPAISVSPSSLDFGSVKIGKKITKTLKITNNSSRNLMITFSGLEGTEFNIQGSSSVIIKAKKSYSLKVLCTATSGGLKTATLEIDSNDPETPTLEISLTAALPATTPDISVAQTTLDFGSVKVGKKVTKTLKITNNGSGDLVITLSGLEGTDFSIQGSSSVTIKGKKSYSLKVLFTPKSPGLETATLEVNSNDLDSPSIDISLSGTGQ